jgi:2-hydroxy-3-keto-5-methylthiopentenyl-1-phosphate phosphatase
MKYVFLCDFDGTVTKEDVVDRVLEEFADPAWIDIERSWVNGEIGSRDCLAMQARLIKAKEHDLLDFVEGIAIDETFVDFAGYCKSHAIEISILSDGIDLFIKSILSRHGLNDIRVFANGLGSINGSYEMVFPYLREDCLSKAGICKCKMMEGLSIPEGINVLVGDGRSDFCLARKVDLTFAKSTLLDFCRVEKIPHIEQREFRNIIEWLRNQIGARGSVAAQRTSIRHGLSGARNG